MGVSLKKGKGVVYNKFEQYSFGWRHNTVKCCLLWFHGTGKIFRLSQMRNYQMYQENNEQMPVLSMHFRFCEEYINSVYMLHKSSAKATIFVICNFVQSIVCTQAACSRPCVLSRNVLQTCTLLHTVNKIVNGDQIFLKALDHFGYLRMPFLFICVAHLWRFALGMLHGLLESTRLHIT